MNSEFRSWALVGFVLLVWLALMATAVVTNNGDALGQISAVIPVLLLGAWAFERWIWRWKGISKLVRTPVLHGTWRGELKSLWLDPDTKKPKPLAPKRVYLVIEQTLLTVTVRLFSEETVSEQIAGSLADLGGGRRALSYTYIAEPSIGNRDKNPMRHGGALIKVLDGSALHLEGEYWAERAGTGSLSFREHRSRLAKSFTDAEILFAG